MLYFLELFRIARRSITQRLVPSILTIMSMALGVCLVVMVLTIVGVVERSFRTNSSLGYNMIIGAKGGQEQLTLNSIYYLSKPVENISYDYFLEFQPKERRDRELANSFRAKAQTLRSQTLALATGDGAISDVVAETIDMVDRVITVDDGRHGRYGQFCEFAIPLCMGDYVEHFRAVGTTPEFFEKLQVGERGFVFAKGRALVDESPEHGLFEAVIGSQVARELKMDLGAKINPLHGSPDGHSHKQPFTVVGVLEPTGTPNDRAVFVNMEGFYLMEDHAKPIEEEAPPADAEPTIGPAGAVAKPDKKEPALPDQSLTALAPKRERLPLEEREVTAALVRNKSPLFAPSMMNGINEGKEAQAVAPVQVIYNLFDLFVSPIKQVLLLLAVAICIVSGISILVSIYNSMNERRHEIAVMRALGAGRGAVMTIILLEAIMLALAGGAVGWFAGHAGAALASPFVENSTGVRLSFFDGDPSVAELAQSIAPAMTGGDQSEAAKLFWSLRAEVVLIPLLIAIAIVVGIWPAISAYRTDVAKSLGK